MILPQRRPMARNSLGKYVVQRAVISLARMALVPLVWYCAEG